MSKQIWKPGTLMAPVPVVMVSCGTTKAPNILTIAWTGIVNTIPPKTYISMRPERYSYNIIKTRRDFVINLTTKDLVFAADFCGVKTGKEIDKFESLGLTPVKASKVSAPIIDESPVNIECKVDQIIEMGSHNMIIADIVAVQVDDSIISKNGKMLIDKANLAAYAHGEYFAIGEKLGNFGYSVRKKSTEKKQNILDRKNGIHRQDGKSKFAQPVNPVNLVSSENKPFKPSGTVDYPFKSAGSENRSYNSENRSYNSENKSYRPSGSENKPFKPSGTVDYPFKSAGSENKSYRPSGSENKSFKPSGTGIKPFRPYSPENKASKTNTKPSFRDKK